MDRLFGELLGRLRRLGIFDQSLIVVTADEGSSYRAGDRRRGPTPTNLADIAYVPLFVKVPGQRQGAVDDAYVQGIDVLPTIAESLDISIPWRVDGHSAFSGPHADTVRFAGEGVSIDAGLLVKQRDAAVKRKVAFFGSEKGSRGLFAIGPHHELVGRLVSALPVAPSSAASATINSRARARLQAVRPGSGFLPALIGGVIHKGRPGMTLAIAVNGRIATTTRSYSISGNGRFAALVPAPVFRRGVNHVQVLEVETSDGALRLRSLGNVS